MRPHLDLSAVEAFVLVADLRSFTHAAEALGLTQAGVASTAAARSAVGRRLLDRTPRQVRLSTDGEAFLPHARTLLAAQELALMTPPEPERELTIAISDHVAGPELPEILARVHACDPALMLKVRVNYSRNVIAQFDDAWPTWPWSGAKANVAMASCCSRTSTDGSPASAPGWTASCCP